MTTLTVNRRSQDWQRTGASWQPANSTASQKAAVSSFRSPHSGQAAQWSPEYTCTLVSWIGWGKRKTPFMYSILHHITHVVNNLRKGAAQVNRERPTAAGSRQRQEAGRRKGMAGFQVAGTCIPMLANSERTQSKREGGNRKGKRRRVWKAEQVCAAEQENRFAHEL